MLLCAWDLFPVSSVSLTDLEGGKAFKTYNLKALIVIRLGVKSKGFGYSIILVESQNWM